jgi:hypothetical protein
MIEGGVSLPSLRKSFPRLGMIRPTAQATIQFDFLTLEIALVLGGQFQKNLIYQKLGNFRFGAPEGLAEREGFEPSRRFPAYTLSRRAPSTTRPPLRVSVFRATVRLSRWPFSAFARSR